MIVSKIDIIGNIRYYNKNDSLHNEDGPDIVWNDGSKEYFINGKRHRKDGPAIEYSNGAKYWYIDGKLHREDGPAIEYSGGYKGGYWLNNIMYDNISSNEEWQKLVRKILLLGE